MPKFGRDDYDQRPPFGDVPDEEPCFFIRGRDPAAQEALRAYAHRAHLLGADPALVDSVRAHARAMDDFQAEHGSKLPTLAD